jgi:hypothetical protein
MNTPMAMIPQINPWATAPGRAFKREVMFKVGSSHNTIVESSEFRVQSSDGVYPWDIS